MNQQTNVTTFPGQQALVQPSQVGQNLTLDVNSMNSMVNLAQIMSTGKATIPQEYRNSPGDCLAVVMQAVQWGMNPFAVAQKTHFVSGKIGYEAQLVNAVITALAPTKDRLHFEWYGPWEKVIGKFEIRKGDKGEYRVPGWQLADEEGIGIKAWATLKGEDEPRVLDLLLAQARTRNSTLWADDPRQQLAYLATKRWSRLYCPDVIMGIYTPDELTEVIPEREINPPPSGNRALDAMRNKQTTAATMPVETAPPPIDMELPAEVDHANAYADHCAAIEGASDTAEWQQAYSTAWAWANETGDQNIITGIKQIAGERKRRFGAGNGAQQ
ncbi:RecT family recombinase [Aeromonas rivipollensis]|uniref:RecT family recombinase n=1 Tax=Aeromonas rivipollensis TaxID=948519 RepID=UPI003D1C6F48